MFAGIIFAKLPIFATAQLLFLWSRGKIMPGIANREVIVDGEYKIRN